MLRGILIVLLLLSCLSTIIAGIHAWPSQTGDWVMAVGGFGSGVGRLDTVELISLDPVSNPVPECLRSLAAFPEAVLSPAGATLEGNRLLL